MSKYRIKEGQSVYDLALAYGYGIEGVVEFLKNAPEIENLNDISLGGREIEVTKKESKLGNYLSLYGTGIASVPQDDNWILASGKWNDAGRWDDNAYWID
tara:strand:+ start:12640 stop:12939 length:300 start_codon:yes stop_codon:yes gene_type:complete